MTLALTDLPQISPSALTAVILLPMLGAVLVCLFRSEQEKQIKTTALFFSVITFFASLFLLLLKEGVGGHPLGTGYAGFEYIVMLSDPLITYSVGIDGISIWLVILTTFLTPVVFLASYNTIREHVREYMVAFLVLETAMLGSLMALDVITFYIFFELMLIPMYLIIGIWGHDRRIYAAIKFFLYTMAGSLLLLVGIIYVYMQMPDGERSFHLAAMLQHAQLDTGEQLWLFLCFGLAFAIKVPLFPFHTWLPDAHVEAPTGGSVILAAVMLKVGTYGLIRFAIPLLPYGAWWWAPWVMALAVIGIIFGAWMAWVQDDMKKLVAYSSVSHLGFAVLGIFAAIVAIGPGTALAGLGNEAAASVQMAMTGSVYTQLSHGLTTGALFLIVGLMYERRHTRQIEEFGGLAKTTPKIALAMMIATLGSVGLPGTSGFVGEFLVLIGAFQADGTFLWGIGHEWFAIVAVGGVLFGAVYMLSMYRRVFFGPVTTQANANMADLTRLEKLYLVPVLALVLVLGIFPNLFLPRIDESVARTQQVYITNMSRFAAENPEVLQQPDEADEADEAAQAADSDNVTDNDEDGDTNAATD